MNQIAQPPIRTKKHPKGRKYTEEEARVLVEKEAEEERRLLARNREGDENPFCHVDDDEGRGEKESVR